MKDFLYYEEGKPVVSKSDSRLINTVRVLKDKFAIDIIGHILILKLIEQRVLLDINEDLNTIDMLNVKLNSRKAESGIISTMLNSKNEKKLYKLETIIKEKNEWLSNWKNDIYSEGNKIYKDIRSMYKSKCNDEKMIIILQEIILAPIYYELNNFTCTTTLKENDLYNVAAKIGVYLNVKKEYSFRIIKNTEKLIKEATGYWSRLLKCTIVGAGVVAITAGLAAPLVATSIGGMMGLSGAAAYTAGLSALGGGAIAVGGLGMAGGTVVLIAGGSLVGGVGGYISAQVASKMNNENILMSIIKMINYMELLNDNNLDKREIIEEIKSDFLDFKHSYETLIMKKELEYDRDKNITINFGYEKMVNI